MANNTFIWESRPTTTNNEGTGFFQIVGGYDIIIREKTTNRPVTGSMVIARNEKELTNKVEEMLIRFEKKWNNLSKDKQELVLKQALMTARELGWEKWQKE